VWAAEFEKLGSECTSDARDWVQLVQPIRINTMNQLVNMPHNFRSFCRNPSTLRQRSLGKYYTSSRGLRETAKEISKLNRLQCFSLCKVVLLSGIEFISYRTFDCDKWYFSSLNHRVNYIILFVFQRFRTPSSNRFRKMCLQAILIQVKMKIEVAYSTQFRLHSPA
jgi:hypothetical protein